MPVILTPSSPYVNGDVIRVYFEVPEQGAVAIFLYDILGNNEYVGGYNDTALVDLDITLNIPSHWMFGDGFYIVISHPQTDDYSDTFVVAANSPDGVNKILKPNPYRLGRRATVHSGNARHTSAGITTEESHDLLDIRTNLDVHSPRHS